MRKSATEKQNLILYLIHTSIAELSNVSPFFYPLPFFTCNEIASVEGVLNIESGILNKAEIVFPLILTEQQLQ